MLLCRQLTVSCQRFLSSKAVEERVLVERRDTEEGIVRVRLNRPDKRNAMDEAMWTSIGQVFRSLETSGSTRVAILEAEGPTFSSGIDLMALAGLAPQLSCPARSARLVRQAVRDFQACFSAVEECDKPVIAAVDGKCIGAGVDLISACDIRYCTKSASFSIKEVAVGLAADVGSLQRLPKICGNHSLLRELAFTGRDFGAEEALQLGVVSRVFESRQEMDESVLKLARDIAGHSPIAVTTTKRVLNFSRDHTVAEGLEYVANWNMAMLQSADMMRIFQASMAKEKPVFPNLDKDK